MRKFGFFLFLVMAGCDVATQPPSDRSGVGQTPAKQPPEALAVCGADRYGDLVGAPYEALLKVRILGPVRVIRPGDAVTEDWQPDRLNIFLTDTDAVKSLSCG